MIRNTLLAIIMTTGMLLPPAKAQDGRWTRIGAEPAIYDIEISGNTIWTWSELGLESWNIETMLKSNHAADIPQYFYSDNVNIDSSGNVWLIVSDNPSDDVVITNYDGYGWTSIADDDIPGAVSRIYDLAVDKLGRVWCRSRSGIHMLDKGKWYSFPAAFEGSGTVEVDSNNMVWFGTSAGLMTYDGRAWNTDASFSGELFRDEHRGIWRKDGDEYWYYEDGVWKRPVWADSVAGYYGVKVLDKNDVWFHYDQERGGGWDLVHFKDGAWTLHRRQNDTYHVLTDIARDHSGNTWMGYRALERYGSGLSLFDGTEWTTYNESGALTHPNVNDIAIDGSGTKWFAAADGVTRLTGEEWACIGSYFYNPAVAVDAGDTAWMINVGGLQYVQADTMVKYADMAFGDYVKSLYVDSRNRKWTVAVKRHTGVYSADDTLYTAYNDSTGFSVFSDPFCGGIGPSGNMLVGTNGYGLAEFTDTGWGYMTSTDGLASNRVTGPIAVDSDSNLWVGTDAGFCRYDGATWRTFTTTDGLPSDTFDAVRAAPGGGLWLGWDKNLAFYDGGVSRIYPIPEYMYARYWEVDFLGGWRHFIRDMEIDVDGSIWLATSNGAIRFDPYAQMHYVSGCVFDDLDADGVRDSNEAYTDIDTVLLQPGAVPVGIDTLGRFGIDLPAGSYTFVHSLGRIDSITVGAAQQAVTVADSSADTILLPFVGIHARRQYVISGTIFHDVDTDGRYDTGDRLLQNHPVRLQPHGLYTATDSAGIYVFNIFAGNYEVSISLDSMQILTTDSMCYSVRFPGADTVSGLDFGIDMSHVFNDLALTVSVARIRPGRTVYANLLVCNMGSVVASSRAVMKFDPRLVPEFVKQGGTAVGDSVVWNIGSFFPFEQRTLEVAFRVPADVSLVGEQMLFTGYLRPVQSDTVLGNNADTVYREVIASYDPNDKQVRQDSLVNPEPLIYTIRFQNTGNDTAFWVQLIDTLDANLDPASIRLLGADHPYDWSLSGTGICTWTFDNINLPDSSIDEPGSHGFVSFSVMPDSGAGPGTVISNDAYIYFDYNPAVRTNTVQTVFYEPSGVYDRIEKISGSFRVSPSPFTTGVTVSLPGEVSGTAVVRAVDGSVVRVIWMHGSDCLRWDGRDGDGVPVGDGVYTVRMPDGTAVRVVKVR